jgi:hypothetical protein
MQDFLGQLLLRAVQPFRNLEVFMEAPVAFGLYPTWSGGVISYHAPSHRPDLTVGYRHDSRTMTPIIPPGARSNAPEKLGLGQIVVPLVLISSKIRISQPEFFDWLGREELVSKGNPHCLSLQVGLRAQLDEVVIDATQSRDHLYLLGAGSRGLVTGNGPALQALYSRIETHIARHML